MTSSQKILRMVNTSVNLKKDLPIVTHSEKDAGPRTTGGIFLAKDPYSNTYLLTSTMGEMRNTLQTIDGSELRGQVKAIVGGAPVTERFAREIGAGGYVPDTASAVNVVKSLLFK